MALLKNSLDQIRAMLMQMSFSQKMLIVSLLVIIVGCVWWMMNFAGTADMAPVFDQSFDQDVQAKLIMNLKAAGIDAEVRDGKVLVSAGNQEKARAVLAINDALPADFAFGFEQVVNDSNIWRSESEKERMWKVAVENELANVLRRFPGVQDAKVIVDRPERATFGRAQDAAGSAAVHLRMKAGAQIDKRLMMAVADWVSGAVRNVPRERVKLVDSTSGKSYRVPSEDAAIPADLLDLTKQYEDHFSSGIAKAIGHIDNVLISVSVKVDSASRREKSVAIDKDNSVSLVTEESSTKSSSGAGGGPGGDPGVTTNAGTAITAGSMTAAAPAMSESEDKTSFENRFGEKQTETVEHAGAIKEVTAAVNIPRSYFASAYKAETGNDATAESLRQFIDAEIVKIRPKVMAAIGLDKDQSDRVAVGWYYDTAAAAPEAQAVEQAGGMMAMLTDHAQPIGLGALAVVSLLMMLMMMRKAAGTVATIAPSESLSPAGAGAGAIGGSPMHFAGDVVVGEAGVADGYLQGMEVDEETLRTQKMVEQVATMVKENPDAAANLIRRWISKKPNNRS